MIYSIVDLGSNTIRLSVYEVEEGLFSLLFQKKAMAGLAGYVNQGILQTKGVDVAIATLQDFKKIVATFGLGELQVFATASLRNVKNSKEAVAAIEAATQLKIDLISGKEEARLDFVGVTQGIKQSQALIVDIGGGSSELVVYENNQIVASTSIPIGSLSLWHRFVHGIVPTKKELKQMKVFIEHELIKNKDVPKANYPLVCGVGGTIRATNKINNDFFEHPKDNRSLSFAHVRNILKLYKNFDDEMVKQILRLAPERINSFIPGLLLLSLIGEYYASENLIVSDYGVREGYLYDRIIKQ
ncbi:MAG: hypothetical protein ACRCZJ_08260 [Erysipelotrichaceae bacterium]